MKNAVFGSALILCSMISIRSMDDAARRDFIKALPEEVYSEYLNTFLTARNSGPGAEERKILLLIKEKYELKTELAKAKQEIKRLNKIIE